eukprot:scaffold258037_cov35-Tisochrysis_lutea.AAC.1
MQVRLASPHKHDAIEAHISPPSMHMAANTIQPPAQEQFSCKRVDLENIRFTAIEELLGEFPSIGHSALVMWRTDAGTALEADKVSLDATAYQATGASIRGYKGVTHQSAISSG